MKFRAWGGEIVVTAVLGVFCVALFLIPGPERLATAHGIRAAARVLTTDDSDVQTHGLLRFGSQKLTVSVLDGPDRGRTLAAVNELRAQMELDKLFQVGDRVIVVRSEGELAPGAVLVAQDYDRIGWTLALFGGFCVLLCVFGGWTGAKALFSFVFSCLMIWKAVIPLALRGWPAAWTIFGAVCILTAVIMYLIAGFTRKGMAAFLGSGAGVLAGLLMAHGFSALMKINGATMPYAQTLLYSGYEFLDLQDVFVGALILASSGAVMDLAMDIASGIEEVARHNPTLSARELTASGMRIGRSVVGTMTTTLLLAYSGGYLTLLMVFCSQGNPPLEFLNNPLVAAEAVKTLIGSFALVLVAPFTALAAGWLLRPR